SDITYYHHPPFGKRGASYQMTRRCKAFLCLK
ncbi:hypothetical protein LTSESEN_2869, partial [Salmonella enterica subsp. enterica serovar Senftenberg str. A4-543]